MVDGTRNLKSGDVFILTTGILARIPNLQVPILTMLNLRPEGFVKAAAQDIPNQISLIAVCPPMA